MYINMYMTPVSNLKNFIWCSVQEKQNMSTNYSEYCGGDTCKQVTESIKNRSIQKILWEYQGQNWLCLADIRRDFLARRGGF